MAQTKIEWTASVLPDGTMLPGYTFNPWVGCTKISPACDHCYAESWAKRTGGAHLWQGERRRTSRSNWRNMEVLDRKAAADGVRRKVFCASLADVFDNQVPSEWRVDLWALIDATPHLDWLLLTKRPQNIAKMLPEGWGDGWPNVWLGTTVENQTEANRRIPHLLSVPARIRFLSCEPLLGPITFRWAMWDNWRNSNGEPRKTVDHLDGLRMLDWVIAGGESGHGARPVHPDWARSLRDQCAAAGVPFFWKQWGEWAPIPEGEPDTYEAHRARGARDAMRFRDGGYLELVGKKAAGALLDGQEWRQFPEPARDLAHA